MKYVFAKPEKLITEEEYWINLSNCKKLKPLVRSCSDCAVKNGFYQEYAVSLQKQPKDIQDAVLDRWDCHNACDRSCAGLREFFNNKTKK